jgi:hypothetical protein
MNAHILLKKKSSNGRYKYLIQCLYCGKKRWVKESIIKVGNGKFCSVICSQAYRKIHKDEYKKPKRIIESTSRCSKCGILLTEKHHGLYGICYTLHRDGSNMCYICEIKLLIKNKQIEESMKLILEFKERALQSFGNIKREEIIKRIWH